MSVRIFGAMRGLKVTGVLVAVLWYYDIDRHVLDSEKTIGEERRRTRLIAQSDIENVASARN